MIVKSHQSICTINMYNKQMYQWLTLYGKNQQIVWLPTKDGSYALHEAIIVPREIAPTNTTGPCLLFYEVYKNS